MRDASGSNSARGAMVAGRISPKISIANAPLLVSAANPVGT